MKKQILLLALLTAIISAKAQFNVYHPFPDSNAWWSETPPVYFCPPTYSSYSAAEFTYSIRADTMINGNKYHIISRALEDYCNGPAGEYTNTLTYACIREDTSKRIYMCCGQYSNHDTLLYNFNLKLGDTLPPIWLTIGAKEPYVVTGVDSLMFGSSYRKQFIIKYKNGSGTYVYDSITEGIGSWHGLLDQINSLPGQPSTKLNCFKQNKDSIGSGCNFLYLGATSIPKLQFEISGYPDPANTNITLVCKLPSNAHNATLRLYNSLGQILKSEVIIATQALREEDVSTIPNGIYYYTLSVNGVVEATSKLVVIH